eukprot:7764279-Ditylum_brightwellii.AAC.1
MTQAIAMTFAFVWNSFVDPRLATTESVEHYFGAHQLLKREATVQEFVEMEKKTSHRLDAVFESNLKVSRDPKK